MYLRSQIAIFCIALSSVVGVLTPHTATAQLQVPSQTRNALQLNVSPEFPKPGQSVTFSVESFQADLDVARITWRVDGSTEQQGVGAQRLTLEAPALGDTTSVTVQANTEKGTFSTDYLMRPTRVSLVWQGQTQTHPFYAGASAHTAGSQVTLTAFPEFVRSDGTRIAPDNLVYTWRRGNQVLNQQSGFGAQSITVGNPGVLRDMTIRVHVRSPDERYQHRAAVIIPVTQPQTRVYPVHPLLGPRFNEAVTQEIAVTEEELTLSAVPYHLSTPTRGSDAAQYTWRLNGEEISVGDTPYRATFRPQGEGSGSADVSVDVRHASEMLQRAEHSFRVTF